MASCGLFIAAPIWAEAQEAPVNNEQFQADQPQIASPKQRAKSLARHIDPGVQLRHNLRDKINRGLVGIVSEGTDETADIALALTGQPEHDGLRLLPIAGAGASQNAEDVLLTRGIDFGIVQTDVLDQMKRNPPFPGVEKYLQYITKLYDRQAQILAGPDIRSIEDLRGKQVNFGLQDSGTYTTATTIFKGLGVEPDVKKLPHPLALDKLRRGEISALVYVATKPSRLFQDIRPEENLHFLTITGNLPTYYSAITINSEDYPELISKDAPVETVEVGTALVAYNWPANSERYQRVNHFVQAFFAHVKDIQAKHPRWRQFDITASMSGWARCPAAEQWLKKAGLTPEESRTTVVVRLDTKQREALFKDFRREILFQEFAAYQKKHPPTIVAYRDDH
jgi:TRAP-type uncharacterized transport system substrate-binding protein